MARTFIHDNMHQPYSLPALAAACGTTPFSLKRIFKKIEGISIANYSLKVRIEKSKVLLVETNNTLQMIAEAVGYTEGNNFQQAFKRVVGCTPGEWRRRPPTPEGEVPAPEGEAPDP